MTIIELKDNKVYYTEETLQEIANKLGNNSNFITLTVSEGNENCFRGFNIIINKTEIKTIL